MNTNTPVWARDIPLLDPEARSMSERAVNLAWAEQLHRQVEEHNRWRHVLAPDPSRNNYTVRGPYRRRRRASRYALPVAACVVLVSVLLGLSGYGQDAVQLLGSAWVS